MLHAEQPNRQRRMRTHTLMHTHTEKSLSILHTHALMHTRKHTHTHTHTTEVNTLLVTVGAHGMSFHWPASDLESMLLALGTKSTLKAKAAPTHSLSKTHTDTHADSVPSDVSTCRYTAL